MKKLVLGLSAGILTVGIVAGILWKQLDTERDRLADLRTRVTELEKTQASALAAANAVSATQAVAVADAAGASAPPPAAPGANPGSRGQGMVRGLAEVLSSPEASDMMRNQVRAALAQQYPDLAAELRLNPAEAEKFMDLLAKQASSMTGDALGMLTGGSGDAAQASQRRMIEKQLASEKEIANALGSKYSAWQDYQGTAAARQEVSQLRSLLGTGQNALTEAQSRPLIDAIGAERTRINKEEQNRMSTALRSSQNLNLIEDQLKVMSSQNERLVNAATSHLSATQLDGYKRMLSQQEGMLRAIMGSMNTSGNAAGQAGAPR